MKKLIFILLFSIFSFSQDRVRKDEFFFAEIRKEIKEVEVRILYKEDSTITIFFNSKLINFKIVSRTKDSFNLYDKNTKDNLTLEKIKDTVILTFSDGEKIKLFND